MVESELKNIISSFVQFSYPDFNKLFATLNHSNKALINNAAIRGKYICQSQSLNLFMDKPDFNKLSSMHFYSWSKGLKTGIYYLRTKPVAQAQQFTIEPENKSNDKLELGLDLQQEITTPLVCRRDDPDCEACGS